MQTGQYYFQIHDIDDEKAIEVVLVSVEVIGGTGINLRYADFLRNGYQSYLYVSKQSDVVINVN